MPSTRYSLSCSFVRKPTYFNATTLCALSCLIVFDPALSAKRERGKLYLVASRDGSITLCSMQSTLHEPQMLTVSEIAFRDYLFKHHKEDLSTLVIGRHEPAEWAELLFLPFDFYCSSAAERRVNEILDDLRALALTSKELRLDRGGPNPTRVDLLGNSESAGLTIIELKKSDQIERQITTGFVPAFEIADDP